MKAYISVSFSKRELVDEEVNAIVNTLKEVEISSFIFVDNYKFELKEPLMKV
jgi:hypothetical protein